mmetsp:Transcript_31809/g.65461  ORF Transcript_31809/g.65461 Transcript_31809/m.65461 type:complete len:100 (-) Transcript_31809:166-465(-)
MCRLPFSPIREMPKLHNKCSFESEVANRLNMTTKEKTTSNKATATHNTGISGPMNSYRAEDWLLGRLFWKVPCFPVEEISGCRSHFDGCSRRKFQLGVK